MTSYSSASAESLIRACAESHNEDAWEEFVSRFHRAISLSVLRTSNLWGGVARQEIEDLIQETYVKLCADRCHSLYEFAVQHPDAVCGYVKTIAINVVHDHFKSLHARKRGSGLRHGEIDEASTAPSFSASGGSSAIEREILLKQIDEHLKICSAGSEQQRDCIVFWLYYQHGMTAKAISDIPTIGLSAKGVESALRRLTSLVRQRIASAKAMEFR